MTKIYTAQQNNFPLGIETHVKLDKYINRKIKTVKIYIKAHQTTKIHTQKTTNQQ